MKSTFDLLNWQRCFRLKKWKFVVFSFLATGSMLVDIVQAKIPEESNSGNLECQWSSISPNSARPPGYFPN